MQDKNVIKLTDGAAPLEQGASILEGLENDERNRGNCSIAEGAGCSAHAVRRLASVLPAHDREIGQCLHQIQEPAPAQAVHPTFMVHTGDSKVTLHFSSEVETLEFYRTQPEAASAAVAVPDERAAFEAWAKSEDMSIGSDCDGYIHSNTAAASLAWQARAALAATPAANSVELHKIKTAAPVVLPEPDAWLAVYEDRDGNSKFYTSTHKDLAVENDTNGKPQPLYTEQQLRALLAQAATSAAPAHPADGVQPVEQGEVLVTVSGFTGCGKSAIAGEIEILCRALGLQVQWPDGDSEKNMTHADWTEALEQYKPRVRIVEQNIPFASKKGLSK